jgi:hypothetical protein
MAAAQNATQVTHKKISKPVISYSMRRKYTTGGDRANMPALGSLSVCRRAVRTERQTDIQVAPFTNALRVRLTVPGG